MVDFRQVEAMIQEQIPDAQVMVRDLTGGGGLAKGGDRPGSRSLVFQR